MLFSIEHQLSTVVLEARTRNVARIQALTATDQGTGGKSHAYEDEAGEYGKSGESSSQMEITEATPREKADQEERTKAESKYGTALHV